MRGDEIAGGFAAFLLLIGRAQSADEDLCLRCSDGDRRSVLRWVGAKTSVPSRAHNHLAQAIEPGAW
jgi:hypothetical protein